MLGVHEFFSAPVLAVMEVPRENISAYGVVSVIVVADVVGDAHPRDRVVQAAKDQKENTFEFSLALQNARHAERAAVHAYYDHVEKHSCSL